MFIVVIGTFEWSSFRVLSKVPRTDAAVLVLVSAVTVATDLAIAVVRFLGVDDDGQTEFERRFESQMYRYRWLQDLLFVPATSDGKIVDTLQQRSRKYNPDGTKKMSFIKRLTNLNKVPKSPDPLTPHMVDTLRETLRPDVQHLSRLLDRDLSHWTDG